MSLSDKIDLLSTELNQRQKAQQARALLQNLRSEIIRTDIELQAIADTGSLNTIDPDVKSALVAGWNICKSGVSAFENNADLKESLDWRP